MQTLCITGVEYALPDTAGPAMLDDRASRYRGQTQQLNEMLIYTIARQPVILSA